MSNRRALLLAGLAVALAGAVYVDWSAGDDGAVRPVRAAQREAGAGPGAEPVASKVAGPVAGSIQILVTPAEAPPAPSGSGPMGPGPVPTGGPPGADGGPPASPQPVAGPPGAGPPGAGPPGLPTASPQAGPPQVAGPVDSAGLHPLSRLSAMDLVTTVQRPLFEASRQPMGGVAPPLPQVAAAMPAAAQADAAGFRLVGVIVSDERTTALLTVPGQAATLRVEAGDTVEGWKVETLKLSHMTLERQGRRVELKMLRQVQ